jgi:glycosyltransferase involved in cell wall biosynthesis
METVSVIIPVKNEAGKIATCLEAVFAQTHPPYEVIVVDGHSTDDTVLNAQAFPVKVFYEDYRTRAGANQIGIEHATGDFIAFTDADCIPQKDWLEKLLKEFREGIVGVGGGIINLGDGTWERSVNLAVSTFLGSANSVQGRFFKEKRFVRSISGCNSMYRKSDIENVHGFDVTLGTAEDTELNSRLLNTGKLIYTPDAIILHNHNRGIKDFARRMYQYGVGRSKSRLFDLQVVPPVFILVLILSLVFTPIVFIAFMALYFVSLLITGFFFAIKEKEIKYCLSVPAVLFIEHGSYTLGFWCGLIPR